MTIDPRAELAVDEQAAVQAAARPAGLRTTALRRLRRDPASIFAACLLLLLVLAALIGGPLAAKLTGHSPIAQYPDALHADGLPIGFFSRTLNATGTATNPHGSLFILGADQLGRDQLVRVLYGARISLLVATSATAIAMAFPNVLLGVGLAIVIGPGLLNVVIIISLFTWYYPARIVRDKTAATKKMTFVAA